MHVLASLLFVALGVSGASPDPDGALRGVVRDASGATVPNAQIDVTCGAIERHVTATSAGSFVVNGLPSAKCDVSARASGYGRKTVTSDVSATPAAPLVLVLTPSEVREDVLVSATRGVAESSFWVPESTSVTTRQDLMSRPGSLMPQVLREEAGIEVQQTTSGQASPIIRGFTGSSNAYLVDGVRFNTSAWRGGPSQYLAWIDTGVVDRLEVVRGPGSVQYGSDALGGTINVRTMVPALGNGPVSLHGSIDGVAATADQSGGGAVSATVRGERASFSAGYNQRTVGSLRTGGGIDSHAAVTRFLGLPNTTYGPRLRDSGFASTGAFASGIVRVSDQASLSGFYMHGNQTGASRYDRIYGGDGVYISGFTPQTLDFGYAKLQTAGVAGFDALSASFSVNQQKDGRFEQTRPTATLDRQNSTTRVYGYNVEGARGIAGRHQVTIGGEYYAETITAARFIDNPLTGASVANRPDVPTGTTYGTLGAFVQDVTEIVPNRLTFRGGLRFARYQFRTVADSVFFVPDEEIVSKAFTYNAGLVLAVTSHVHLTFTTSRGFRAGNSADLGGIGLSGGGGFGITPSRAAALGGLVGSTSGTDAVSTGQTIPALRPEVLYAYEAGVKVNTAHVGGAISFFDNEYEDTIQGRAVVFPAGIVGQTISGFLVTRQDANGLAYIAQDARPISTRVNLDHSRMRGMDVEAHASVGQWTAAAYFSMTNAKLLSTGEALRRMPPPMGGARVRWAPTSRVWVEGVMAFARTQTRMNSGDLTDARIGANRTRTSIASYFNGTATDLGLVKGGVLLATGETLAQVQTRLLGTATAGTMFDNAPGWITYGLRGSVVVSRQVTLTAIGENLTDRNYRVLGSGVDAAGRNLQVVLSLKF